MAPANALSLAFLLWAFALAAAQSCLFEKTALTRDAVGDCVPADVNATVLELARTFAQCAPNATGHACQDRALLSFSERCADAHGQACQAYGSLGGQPPRDRAGCDGTRGTTVAGVPLQRWADINRGGRCPFQFEDPGTTDIPPSFPSAAPRPSLPPRPSAAPPASSPSAAGGPRAGGEGAAGGAAAASPAAPQRVCYDVRLTPGCRRFAHARHAEQAVLCVGGMCATPGHLVRVRRDAARETLRMERVCAALGCSARRMLVNTCIDAGVEPSATLDGGIVLSFTQFDDRSPVALQRVLNAARRAALSGLDLAGDVVLAAAAVATF